MCGARARVSCVRFVRVREWGGGRPEGLTGNAGALVFSYEDPEQGHLRVRRDGRRHRAARDLASSPAARGG